MTDTAPQRSRLRHNWSVSYPLIVGSLSSTALTVVDAAILGHYSTAALATIALAAPVFVLASAAVVPWGTAVQVLVARWHGAEDRVRIARMLDIGLVLCLAVGLVLAGVLALAAPLILRLLAGGDPPPDAVPVLQLLMGTLPFIAVTAHYRGVFGGLGLTSVTMQVSLLVNILNIPLDWVFVFGLDLGAIGSAIGTLSATAMGAAYVAWLARRRLNADYPFGRRAHLRESGDIRGQLWRIGWPDVSFAMMVYGADVLLATIVATLGVTELAGYRLMIATVSVLWVFVFSCSSGISILAGQRLGAGQIDEAIAYARSGAVLMAGLCCLVVAFPLIAPDLYFGFFSGDAEVRSVAADAVLVLLLLVPGMVVSMSLAGVLRAGGDTKGIMYAGALSQLLLAVPIAWAAVNLFGLGLEGIYIGFATGIIARAVFTVLRFRAGHWRAACADTEPGNGST